MFQLPSGQQRQQHYHCYHQSHQANVEMFQLPPRHAEQDRKQTSYQQEVSFQGTSSNDFIIMLL